MRGLPKFIQTRADLQNLFELCKQGECSIECAPLIEKIRGLLNQQYFTLPILEKSGNDVTLFWFNEAQVGAVLENGATITAFGHIEATEDELTEIGEVKSEETVYIKTILTLSEAAPDDIRFLKVYNPCNCIVENGFDIDEINYILGVLESMHNTECETNSEGGNC